MKPGFTFELLALVTEGPACSLEVLLLLDVLSLDVPGLIESSATKVVLNLLTLELLVALLFCALPSLYRRLPLFNNSFLLFLLLSLLCKFKESKLERYGASVFVNLASFSKLKFLLLDGISL